MKKTLLTLITALLFINLVGAVTIDDVFLNATVSNLTINVTSTMYTDSFTVEATSIYFENLRRSGTEYVTFNITESNADYLGTDLPYLSSSSSTSKTVTSGLSDTVIADITVNLNTCESIAVQYRRTNDTIYTTLPTSNYTCSGGVLVLDNQDVQYGNNLINIANAAEVDICEGWTDSANTFISFFIIIVVVGVAGIIMFFIAGSGEAVDLTALAFALLIAGITLSFGAVIILRLGGC